MKCALSNADCGLSITEYKMMMKQPRDPTRKQRDFHPRHHDLEVAYGLRFPSCFFALYDSCKLIDPKDPLNAIAKCGLALVGAYEEWHKMANNEHYIPDPNKRIERNLIYRGYYSPPEMQTLVVGIKSAFQLGYWRDDPMEVPSFTASSDGQQGRISAGKGILY